MLVNTVSKRTVQAVVWSIGFLLALSLIGVACGSSNDEQAGQSQAPAEPAVASETEQPALPQDAATGGAPETTEVVTSIVTVGESDAGTTTSAEEVEGNVGPGFPTIPVPPDLDLYEAATRLRTGPDNPPSRSLAPTNEPYEVGESASFYVYDPASDENYAVTAVLKHVSDNAYWYVGPELEFPQSDLVAASELFENRVRPEITGSLGDIRSPGVDGDPKLTVLNTVINQVGGLFSSADGHTVQVHPYSNQREMVYISADKYLDFGTVPYLRVLAHEFMHAVHANLDNSEEAWVDEGLAEFAVDVSGYPRNQDRHDRFLSNPGVQLNYMDYESIDTLAHYEAAHRFFVYLSEHFGGNEAISELLREPADGALGVDAFLKKRGLNFTQVFKDWVVANYINELEGPYGYAGSEVGRARTRHFRGEAQLTREAKQFSAVYLDIRPLVEDFTIEFEGASETTIFGGSCYSGRGCWWSNKGDSIDTTLTREFDLTGVSEATLEYMAWFEIEEGWDYAYLEVSADNGQTWDILHPERASDEDRLGNAYGPGYTGDSKGWVAESVDISDYSGDPVLVRFEYITDGAVHADGFVLDDISIPEAGFFDDAEQDQGWTASGFARIENVLPQKFIVQVIADRGDENFEVFDMPLEDGTRGQALIQGLGTELEKVILAVSPVTLGTHQPTSYTVKVKAASE